MKKITLLMIAIICSCVCFISCDKKDDDGSFERDNSLAGSISSFVPYSIAEAKCTYDAIALENFNVNSTYFDIHKISDTKVALQCYANYGSTKVEFIISEINVGGIPYDAIFDDISADTIVKYNDIEYKSVSTTIKGWIKEVPLDSKKSSKVITKFSPRIPDYTCDITLNCTIDSKVLDLKITSIKR